MGRIVAPGDKRVFQKTQIQLSDYRDTSGKTAMALISNRLAWPAALLLAISFFTAYCQIHAWVDAAEAPLIVSLRWGLLVGSLVVLSLFLISRHRETIALAAVRGTEFQIGASFGASTLVALIGAAAHTAATLSTGFIERYISHIFDIIPLAAAAGLIVFIVLRFAATIHNLRSAAVGRPSWIEMPEEPLLKLRPSEVQYIRSAGNYCEFVGDKRNFLVRVPMKTVAARLESAGFVRVHRTVLLNSDRVRTVAKNEDGYLGAYLDSGAFIPVSRSFKLESLA